MPLKDLTQRREYTRLYRRRNREQIEGVQKQYREAHRKELAAKQRARNAKGRPPRDKEKAKAQWAVWYAIHRHDRKLKAQKRAWGIANRERRNARQNARYRANPEKRLNYSKAWRAAHPERAKAMALKNYQQQRRDHLEKLRERGRERHRAHAEENNAKQRARRAADQQTARARDRIYYTGNKTRMLASTRAWQKRNPERGQVACARRRARRLGATGSHTAAEWIALLASSSRRCFYCGAGPLEKPHREHRIPLSRGGSDDIANIVVSCRSCNSRKHTMTDSEFISAQRSEWLIQNS